MKRTHLVAVTFLSLALTVGCSDSGSSKKRSASTSAATTSASGPVATTTGGTVGVASLNTSVASGSTASGSTASGSTASGATTGGATTGGATTGGATTGGATTTPPVAPPAITPETDPPVITLTSPSRGQFTTLSQILVEGTIADASGLAYFLINGNLVTPGPNGNFSQPLTLTDGLNVIEILAADPWANQTKTALPVISGQFLPETSDVTDALAVRLNLPVFDAIEQIAAQQLGGVNLANEIMNQNPLFSGGGTLANVRVEATAASFGTPVLSLDPELGGLRVKAELPNISITVNASGRVIGIPFSLTTDVTTTNAIVEATAVVNVAAGGVITTDMQNVVIDMQGFRFNIHGVPTFLENLARSAVRNLIEKEIKKQVETVIPREINNAIAGANGPITQTVMGQQVTIELIPTAVNFDPDGASIMTDGDVVITPPAGLSLPTTPGSLTTAGTAPAHGLTNALYLSVNDDLLNRIAHAAWRGGLTNFTLDQAAITQLQLPAWLQLDAFLLQTFFPSLAGQLNPNDPLEIEISTATPAIFQTRPAPGLLTAGIGDLQVDIYVAPAGLPRQLVLSVGTQIEAEVGVSLSAQNTLQVAVIGRPTINTDVFQTPLATLNETAVENLMGFILPPVIQLLGNSWSGFPIPTTPGLNIRNLVFEQDGPALDFVTLRGDL